MAGGCDLVDASVLAYAKGARDLDSFAKQLRTKYGANVGDDVMQAAFTKAAQRYKTEYSALDDIKKQMAGVIGQEAYKSRPWIQKVGMGAQNVIGAGRSIVTSVDLSAPGRQGYLLLSANPKLGGQSFVPMLRAAVSEDGAQAIDAAIKTRPNAPRYEEAGLDLSSLDHADSLKKAEEAYRTNLAEKIPGVGHLIRGSERAYVTFLNKIRADNFDSLVGSLEKNGRTATPEETKAIAGYVNVATGRGNLGQTGTAAADLLNNVFFAPRFAASRFQYLAGQPMYQGTAATRALIARQYLQTAATTATVLGLAKLAGAEISTDPRSSDFLKIKVGNTRVDVGAGLQQVTVLAARLATGEKTGSRGQIIPLNGKGVNGTRLTVTGDFLRGKLAPIPGTITDLLAGKDMAGQPVTIGGEIKKNVVPMNYQDVVSAAKQEGIPTTAAVQLLQLFGINANVQEPRAASGGSGLHLPHPPRLRLPHP